MESFCKLEKRCNLFILTIAGNDDHRLNPMVIDSILIALKRARNQATGLSALISTAEGKFFSNGLDLEWAGTNLGRLQLMSAKLRALISELITFPMPTIAAVTGHASAGGLALAIAHDYLLMRKDRGFLYVSELDIGFQVPLWFSALMKCKVGSPKTLREIVMKASEMTAEMGLQGDIIDSAHDGAEATVEAAEKLGMDLVRRNWNGQVYADNRRALFAEAILFGSFSDNIEGKLWSSEASPSSLFYIPYTLPSSFRLARSSSSPPYKFLVFLGHFWA